jgi:hypothetical protein
MKDGKCPKGVSQYVRVRKNNTVEQSDAGNWLKSIHLNAMPVGKKLGVFSDKDLFAEVDNYVCLSCGYVETYIAKPEDLDFIAQNWEAAVKEFFSDEKEEEKQ